MRNEKRSLRAGDATKRSDEDENGGDEPELQKQPLGHQRVATTLQTTQEDCRIKAPC